MDTDNIKNLFNSFYDRMVLRDFFGKVIPGLIFLSTIFICLCWEYTECSMVIDLTKNLSFLAWLVIFGAAWITAFGIQAMGELVGKIKIISVIRYYPKEKFKNGNYEEWLKFREKFRKKADPEQKVEAERFVVITEACGNGCMSLLISFIFTILFELFFGHITWQILWDSWRIWLPIVMVTWFFIIFLGKMHKIHVVRHYDYMKLVIDGDC